MTTIFDFNEYYEHGKEGENEIAEYLRSIGRKVDFLPKERQHEGDLLINDSHTMEIKTDFIETKPHNLAFEYAVTYFDKGSRNGAIFTQADFFLYYFKNHEFYYLLTQAQLAQARHNMFTDCRNFSRIVAQNAEWFSSMFLYSIKRLEEEELCIKVNMKKAPS